MTVVRTPTRGLCLTAAIALTVGVAGLTGTGTASAGTYVYDLGSEAVAVQTTFTDPNVPLGLPFSVGSYGASSRLNSNGESQADAGAPYSPLVSSFPSTGNGLVQSASGVGLPVVPTFPGYVSAKDPVLPTNKQNAGGYELVATALPQQASGKASLGGQAATSEQNNAFAVANSVATDDGIFSEGAAGVHALTLDGILDLFNVSSYASLTQQAGGAVVPVTTTSLGTVSFAGVVTGLTGDGATAFGSQPTPLNVDGLAALNEALKPAGIALTYLPEEYRYADGSTSVGPTVDAKKDVAGVTSGALRIFFTTTSDRGTTTETLTLGQVTVSAAGNVLGGSPADGADSAGAGSALSGAGGTAGRPGTDFAAAPGLGLTPGAAPAGLLPTRNFVPAAAAGTVLGEGTTSFESFYLFVALAGAVALVGSQVVRVAAVRRSG
jgi:hypothetical protein